uniref:Uncharacterized protein n=1 Tax=Trypanosoma vivax (strain Y486) TaxID=1055687 RepID=G0TUE1_TRYVY|nr:conserved hypothetical protein [Trypanosoma vivax Y486]
MTHSTSVACFWNGRKEGVNTVVLYDFFFVFSTSCHSRAVILIHFHSSILSPRFDTPNLMCTHPAITDSNSLTLPYRYIHTCMQALIRALHGLHHKTYEKIHMGLTQLTTYSWSRASHFLFSIFYCFQRGCFYTHLLASIYAVSLFDA